MWNHLENNESPAMIAIKDIAAGSIGGVFQCLVGHPLDTIKVLFYHPSIQKHLGSSPNSTNKRSSPPLLWCSRLLQENRRWRGSTHITIIKSLTCSSLVSTKEFNPLLLAWQSWTLFFSFLTDKQKKCFKR